VADVTINSTIALNAEENTDAKLCMYRGDRSVANRPSAPIATFRLLMLFYQWTAIDA